MGESEISKSSIDSFACRTCPDDAVGVTIVLLPPDELPPYICPLPNISQSMLMSGIFFLMASTMLRVGLVRSLKMLLSDAGDISRN